MKRADQSTPEVYCMERSLPGLTEKQLAGVHWALHQTVERVAKNGGQIRYVRSTFLPDQSRCICIFESSSRELVRTVNETAQIPSCGSRPRSISTFSEIRHNA